MVVTQATSVDDTLSLVSDSARVIAGADGRRMCATLRSTTCPQITYRSRPPHNSAAWRAIETEEDTPLCVDPFAAQLAGTHALKVARSMAQVRGASLSTRFVDCVGWPEEIRAWGTAVSRIEGVYHVERR